MKGAAIALACMMFVGCASLETQRDLADAKENVERFISAVDVADIDLIDAAGMTEAAAEEKLRTMFPGAEAACFEPHRSRLLAAFSREYDMSPGSVSKLTTLAITMDGELTACLKPLGLTGSYGLEVGQKVLPAADYIREADRALKYYRHTLQAAHQEAEANKITFAYAMMGAGQALQGRAAQNPYANPSQTYIAPYVKSDGTYVQGHRRTIADGLCFNNLNLRGCR